MVDAEPNWADEYRKARTRLNSAKKRALENQKELAQAKEHYAKMEIAYRVEQLLSGAVQGK
jgi:hypothetical protein